MIDNKVKKLIDRYGGAVPRYTSYPTAVQFHADFTTHDLISCLEAISPYEPISLYIHIPFCHSLCHYCGCHTKIVHQTGVISSYIDTLCREIALVASLAPRGSTVSRIHFGGGSPNYAPTADIARILDAVWQSFAVAENLQIDMECDPRLLNDQKILELTELGIRRVSLGIQDFDEKVQKAVNRIQPLDDVRAQVGRLRNCKVTDINFDLIAGLPGQTSQSVRNTALAAIELRPSRIAVFSYAHVPWMKRHQKLLERHHLPSPEERFLMQKDIEQILKSGGYKAIGIDHYALPDNNLFIAHELGDLRRNFQGYTDDSAEVILGFGLSAISQFKNAYAQNTLDSGVYRTQIDKDHLPMARGVRLNKQDIQAKKAIMHLMCYFELDMKEYQDLYIKHDQLALMVRDGLLTQEEYKIQITDIGKPFTRVVASCFDQYFKNANEEGGVNHARAI